MKKIILIIIALFSFGCAAKIDMTIVSPAKNNDLLDYKSIAIYSVITSDKADSTADFEKALSEIELDGKKYFKVKKEEVTETVEVVTCDGGIMPDANGCCPGETYTDMGDQGFNCCPDAGGDCFPPIINN